MTKIVDVLLAKISNIEELSLNGYEMDDEAVILGNALCTTITTLKKLYMRGIFQDERRGSITPKGMDALSVCLSKPSSSLEELHLDDNHIGISSGISLSEELSNNSTLKVLDISSAVSPNHSEWIMSSIGWNMFFEFFKSLSTMISLKDLNLQNTRITSSGWVKFFELLKSPGSVLKSLINLNIRSWEAGMNDKGLTLLSQALVGNSSLQKVSAIGAFGTMVDNQEEAWTNLSNTLCDKSSIESIYNSNHSFQSFIAGNKPPVITSLLELNKGTDKTEVARQKIFRYYLSDVDNLHTITSTDIGVLPHAMRVIGKDVSCFTLFYQIIQGMPHLFNIKQVVGGKRKREN